MYRWAPRSNAPCGRQVYERDRDAAYRRLTVLSERRWIHGIGAGDLSEPIPLLCCPAHREGDYSQVQRLLRKWQQDLQTAGMVARDDAVEQPQPRDDQEAQQPRRANAQARVPNGQHPPANTRRRVPAAPRAAGNAAAANNEDQNRGGDEIAVRTLRSEIADLRDQLRELQHNRAGDLRDVALLRDQVVDLRTECETLRDQNAVMQQQLNHAEERARTAAAVHEQASIGMVNRISTMLSRLCRNPPVIDNDPTPEEADPGDANGEDAVDRECSICLLDVAENADQTTCRAQCHKVYHLECMNQWAEFADRVTCPSRRVEWLWDGENI